MRKKMTATKWWAKGLLFENCNCQLICPGHMSFKQQCTHERCMGHWAIHIDEGRYGNVPLNHLNMVILYDAPQKMYEGGWTEAFYIDERANDQQREALETIFSGQAGGPWKILSMFVSERQQTRYVPIHLEDNGRQKKMWIDGYFNTTINAIRAKDDKGEVVLSNLFNQIHSSQQVLARGETRGTDGAFDIKNKDTHALYSTFSWDNG